MIRFNLRVTQMRDVNENPLPGVPFIESPFFDRIFVEGLCPPKMLTIAQNLRTKGYAVIDFPDPQIGNRADRIMSTLHNSVGDWSAWRAGRSLQLKILDAWSSNEDVREIATNQEIINLLSFLYGRRAFPRQTLNFAVGSQEPLHTDYVQFGSNPERFMCAVWVALEDVGPDSGPLFYCPGSHAWPIYTNEHIGKNSAFLDNFYGYYGSYRNLWNSLVDVHGARPERFFARRGQAIIWAANLLHGGDQMRDLNRTRWSQITWYSFEGCSYYAPAGSDPFFGQIMFVNPVDISSGRLIPSSVSGHRVARQFIDAVAPKIKWSNVPFKMYELPDGFEPERQDPALAARDAAYAERDAALAARDAAYAERDAALTARDTVCKTQDTLLRSTSWRITAPLRALSLAVRRR